MTTKQHQPRVGEVKLRQLEDTASARAFRALQDDSRFHIGSACYKFTECAQIRHPQTLYVSYGDKNREYTYTLIFASAFATNVSRELAQWLLGTEEEEDETQ